MCVSSYQRENWRCDELGPVRHGTTAGKEERVRLQSGRGGRWRGSAGV